MPPEAAEGTRYEQILQLLMDEGPMSTWSITRALDINGTGQVLTRLRFLAKRGRVERVERPDHPGWHVWRLL